MPLSFGITFTYLNYLLMKIRKKKGKRSLRPLLMAQLCHGGISILAESIILPMWLKITLCLLTFLKLWHWKWLENGSFFKKLF